MKRITKLKKKLYNTGTENIKTIKLSNNLVLFDV